MSKIDLSKAKIGDKFRDRCGRLYELIYTLKGNTNFRYLLVNEQKDNVDSYLVDGSYLTQDMSNLDLVEEVLYEPLDELIEEATKQFRESVIAKENKLQRRQEVVELADRIFFSERGSAYSFKDCIEVAEYSVNMINQYLKEGKL